eukprot:scaffold55684_cov101-Phaeocystis_antarctica.AAC.5
MVLVNRCLHQHFAHAQRERAVDAQRVGAVDVSMRVVPCRLPGRPTQVHFVQMRCTTRTKANVGYKGRVPAGEACATSASEEVLLVGHEAPHKRVVDIFPDRGRCDSSPPCDMVDRSEGARRREAGLAVRRVERVSHHHAVARFAAEMLRIPPETPHGSRADAIDTGVYVPHLEVAVVKRYCRRIIKSGRSTPREPVTRYPHAQRVELDHAEDSQLDAHLYWLAEVCVAIQQRRVEV